MSNLDQVRYMNKVRLCNLVNSVLLEQDISLKELSTRTGIHVDNLKLSLLYPTQMTLDDAAVIVFAATGQELTIGMQNG